MSVIEEFRDKYKGQRCAIIGKGPSLIRLSSDMLVDVDFVIAVNQSILKLRELGITSEKPVFYVKKDACAYGRNPEQPVVEANCSARREFGRCWAPEPIEPEMLLVHTYESPHCFKNYTNRIEFTNTRFGLLWRHPTVTSSIHIAKLLGAVYLKMISFDAYTFGDCQYTLDGKTIAGTDQYILQKTDIDNAIRNCRFQKVEFLTP